MVDLKDKLIAFPKEILDVLDEYKTKTGIPATDYIRRAVVKQMIVEGMIYIKMKYIEVVEERGDKGKKLNISDAIKANKFCDGDKCELPALINKSC